VRLRAVLQAAVGSVLLANSAAGREAIQGPVAGTVVRVIDGDTFEFSAHVWLGLDLTTHVRVRGIDTPEIHGKCTEEKAAAVAASERLRALISGGVTIANVAEDKYFGRVVADVTTTLGGDVGAAMIATGLARPYDGRTRQSWC
jgi:micrococcal nuclease